MERRGYSCVIAGGLDGKAQRGAEMDVYPSLTYRDVEAALEQLERAFRQRGYSARDLEGNLWSFGTSRPEGGREPADATGVAR
jgi:hypothetical protein